MDKRMKLEGLCTKKREKANQNCTQVRSTEDALVTIV